MAMLKLRKVYRRYKNVKHRKDNPEAAMQALGYRCKIALVSGPLVESLHSSIVPTYDSQPIKGTMAINATTPDSSAKHLPLQMYLATESGTYDAGLTVLPRIGALTPISFWKLVVLYGFGWAGGMFAALSMFLSMGKGAEVIAVSGVVTSTLFSGVFACCCQRQLFWRVITSFHFIFLTTQMIATAFCVIDIISGRWIPTCGVVSSLVLAYTVVAVDALTPTMKVDYASSTR
ncbi:unnamed protein product [Phytophthora lilii]|uniref:Unnamed protein product n=1 Tax=Phytophthora lilii TaxID=2077276 RepID=A0A9W6UB38_9STRA|nr:unnamed protein product [Phytophthora lilii]